MNNLTHFRLCPRSRAIRLALAELHLSFDTGEVRPWALDKAFLQINPAGELPVLETEGGELLCGAYAIVEYFDDVAGTAGTSQSAGDGSPKGVISLLPGGTNERAEVRRLIDWFLHKMDREVTRELLHEKVYPGPDTGERAPPNAELLRALHSNLRYHLSYISYLADQRRWLAGEELSFADLSAAAHVSIADYLGEVPWDGFPVARAWYAKIKSRPAFRSLLQDRLPGMPPPLAYSDLDF